MLGLIELPPFFIIYLSTRNSRKSFLALWKECEFEEKKNWQFSVSDFINTSEGSLLSELLLSIATRDNICYCVCDWQVSISLDTLQMSRIKYKTEMMYIKCANSHTQLRGLPFVIVTQAGQSLGGET